MTHYSERKTYKYRVTDGRGRKVGTVEAENRQDACRQARDSFPHLGSFRITLVR